MRSKTIYALCARQNYKANAATRGRERRTKSLHQHRDKDAGIIVGLEKESVSGASVLSDLVSRFLESTVTYMEEVLRVAARYLFQSWGDGRNKFYPKVSSKALLIRRAERECRLG